MNSMDKKVKQKLKSEWKKYLKLNNLSPEFLTFDKFCLLFFAWQKIERGEVE